MMGRQSRQMAMIFVDIESLIPETHLLRKIERMVSFDFIYDLLAPYYPATGRPSVDPVSMFKMLLIGYLYGIKSERRLVEEVQLNIAYRWFCGFELDDTIPNHSTFSKTRTRKWQQSSLFQKAFYEIVKQCIDSGLIDGEAMAADGSYIPANVSRESWINVETEVEQSIQSYLDSLDEELSNQPGFKKPPTKIVSKMKVFLYIRVACADQLAAASQREALERYAKDKGYEVAAAVAADGISGVHTEGIMNFLLNEAKRQDIGTILTRDTSRISRDTSSFMRFERKFKENGIRFEYLSKPSNELPVTPMMEAFEAAYKKRRTKNGTRA